MKNTLGKTKGCVSFVLIFEDLQTLHEEYKRTLYLNEWKNKNDAVR